MKQRRGSSSGGEHPETEQRAALLARVFHLCFFVPRPPTTRCWTLPSQQTPWGNKKSTTRERGRRGTVTRCGSWRSNPPSVRRWLITPSMHCQTTNSMLLEIMTRCNSITWMPSPSLQDPTMTMERVTQAYTLLHRGHSRCRQG